MKDRNLPPRVGKTLQFIVIALTLPLILAGHSVPSAGQDGYLLDRSEEGYRVRSISGWEVVAAEPGDAVDAYFSHDHPTVEINIIVIKESGLDTVDQEFLDTVVRTTTAEFRDAKVVHKRISRFNRQPAGSYSFTGIDPNDPEEQRAYLLQHLVANHGDLIIITVSAVPEDVEKARPFWDAFLQQIELVRRD